MATLNLTLYKNYSSPRVASKALGSPLNVANVVLKHECPKLSPTFILPRDLVDGDTWLNDYNYLYVHEWRRYYFAKMSYAPGGQVILTCEVDPLTTYQAGVRQLTCLVERQETYYDPYLIDEYLPISQGSTVTTYKGSKVGSDSYAVFLTCVGSVPEEGGGE